jgi:uncharacterized protein (DUF1778 family)
VTRLTDAAMTSALRTVRIVLDITRDEADALGAAVDAENREVDDGRTVTLEEWAIDQLRRAAGMDDRRGRAAAWDGVDDDAGAVAFGPPLAVDQRSFERVVDRIDNPRSPTDAARSLVRRRR